MNENTTTDKSKKDKTTRINPKELDAFIEYVNGIKEKKNFDSTKRHQQLTKWKAALAALDVLSKRQQIESLKTSLKAVIQKKLKVIKVLDPLQYQQYQVKYGHTEAERIMAAIRLGDLEDKYRKPEVVGTRITEEPYAYDANRTLGSFEQKHRYVAAQEIAAQGDPKKQIIYGDKSKEVKKTSTFEDAKAIIDFMKSRPKVILKGTRHIPTKNEIEAMQKANERIKEGNLRGLEAKASAEKEGIVYGNKAKETSSANKRHHQLIRLKAYLAALYVLNKKSVTKDEKLSTKSIKFLKKRKN